MTAPSKPWETGQVLRSTAPIPCLSQVTGPRAAPVLPPRPGHPGTVANHNSYSPYSSSKSVHLTN